MAARAWQGGIGVAGIGLDRPTTALMKRIFNAPERFYCCGFFPNAETTLDELLKRQPRLVVAKLALGKACGIDLARALVARAPALGVLLSTVLGEAEPSLQKRMISAGVAGFVAEPLTAGRLEERLWSSLLRSASASGGQSASRPASAAGPPRPAADLNPDDPRSPNPYGLAEREKAFLTCLASGLSYKQIEDDLGLGEALVKKIQHSAYEKLDAPNAVVAALKWRPFDGCARPLLGRPKRPTADSPNPG